LKKKKNLLISQIIGLNELFSDIAKQLVEGNLSYKNQAKVVNPGFQKPSQSPCCSIIWIVNNNFSFFSSDETVSNLKGIRIQTNQPIDIWIFELIIYSDNPKEIKINSKIKIKVKNR